MPNALPAALDKVADRIEKAEWLDAAADKLSGLLSKVLPNGPVKDAASGTPIGHPLHPLLVTVPIGSWIGASYLDFAGGKRSRRAAQRLVAFGIVSALPTAVAGASDWSDTQGAERRLGLAHAIMNYTALGLYTGSWLARRRGRQARGVALALAGSTALGAGGWLGGHLSYALGVGVDTTAFEQLPTDWTDVAAEGDITASPIVADAGGVPVLLVRHDGTIRAIADRCTHRGGPLHEGEMSDGCVVCPWHGSSFHVDDGSIERGPATRPQPAFEVQISDGRVAVRRATEPRALRTNPVG
jgi:nitrite reductase/ring-hydroxylating ferredoxin subunit/uncharacterized membrane protein